MPAPHEIRVMGLDLSLTSTGQVLVPGDWGGDWSRIARQTLRPKLPTHATEDEKIERITKTNASIIAFAKEHRPTHVVVEQYAMRLDPRTMNRCYQLGELGGLVKAAVRQFLGLPIRVMAPSTARSFLLGKIPNKAELDGMKLKDFVAHHMTRMGMPLEFGGDETDALVCVNCVLGELPGCHAYALPRPSKAKRARRKAA